jgi:2',3'-cyclic-nucleotide 2'-phosphodiesterase (5'-nucleotidase family)
MHLIRRTIAVSLTAAVAIGLLTTGTSATPKSTTEPRTAVTLTLLHNNDGESSLLSDQTYATPFGRLNVGGAAVFSTVMKREIKDARDSGNAVLSVYAGDSFLASKTLICSEPSDPKSKKPVLDAVAQRLMPYDLHVLGNHEFDYGTAFLRRYINAFAVGGRNTHPFISGNMDFRRNADLRSLVGPAILDQTNLKSQKILGRSYVHVDPETGHRFGVVSAMTPMLRTISSPGTARLTSSDIASTAKVLQGQIDALTRRGVNKIIFVSHLQDIANDKALVALLRNVDAAVAGGGDELLASSKVPLTQQLIPGESAPVDTYPIMVKDRSGKNVPIVTTSGNYKYLGRVDLRFNRSGSLSRVIDATSYPRRVIPTSGVALLNGVIDFEDPDSRIVREVEQPLNACLEEFSKPFSSTEIVFATDRGSATTLGVRTAETNGGNLVADSFLYMYGQRAVAAGLQAPSASNPVVVIQNGGGIRQNGGVTLPINGQPGAITRGQTFDLLPFDNRLVAIRSVTATQMKEIFERSCSVGTGGGGQFLQIAGMKVECSRSGTAQVVANPTGGAMAGTITTPGTRVRSIVLADGRALVTAGQVVAGAPTVTVVTNNFTAGGGDNYPTLAALTAVPFNVAYEQALYEYLLSFPKNNVGLPAIPASDARYAQRTGEGRFVWLP